MKIIVTRRVTIEFDENEIKVLSLIIRNAHTISDSIKIKYDDGDSLDVQEFLTRLGTKLEDPNHEP